MKADVATGEAQEVWHNQPNDRIASTITNPRLAGDYLVFPLIVRRWTRRTRRAWRGRASNRRRRTDRSTNGIAITR